MVAPTLFKSFNVGMVPIWGSPFIFAEDINRYQPQRKGNPLQEGVTWEPGAWFPPVEGDLWMCHNGYHAAGEAGIPRFLAMELYTAELGPEGRYDPTDDKYVARTMRLTSRVETWTRERAQVYLIGCLTRVLDAAYHTDQLSSEQVTILLDRMRLSIQPIRGYLSWLQPEQGDNVMGRIGYWVRQIHQTIDPRTQSVVINCAGACRRMMSDLQTIRWNYDPLWTLTTNFAQEARLKESKEQGFLLTRLLSMPGEEWDNHLARLRSLAWRYDPDHGIVLNG